MEKGGAAMTAGHEPKAGLPSTFRRILMTRTLASAAMTGATLLAISATSVSALPFGFPRDIRRTPTPPSEIERPATSPQSPARSRATLTAARSTTKPVTNSAPGANDPLAKANAPLQIIIALDKQQLTLYAAGEVVARSRVSTGMRGYGTPAGVFSIIQKDRWHRSNLYDDAPMYFMQRITWSGVALHQGIVPSYPASHGCVRLPESFARQLWGRTSLGVRVIIARNQLTPVAIEHPRLFAPKIEPAGTANSVTDSLKAAEQAWKLARYASMTPIAGATATDVIAPGAPAFDDAGRANARVLKSGPVSVFISRKEGRVFVRKDFEPVFDMPIAIERPDLPLGTHVFTALARNGDKGALRWTVVSMEHASTGSPGTAAAALDRITIPQEALDRISELTSPGASLILSDQGLGPETGKGTDFIVLTH